MAAYITTSAKAIFNEYVEELAQEREAREAEKEFYSDCLRRLEDVSNEIWTLAYAGVLQSSSRQDAKASQQGEKFQHTQRGKIKEKSAKV